MEPTARMREFIQSHIHAASESDAPVPPDPTQCLRVEEVAPLSVAAAVGIAVGDVLVTVDGKSAASVQPKLYQAFATKRRYVFYSAELGKTLDLEASGIDIGVVLGRTPAALRARGSATADELLSLWKAKEWALLADSRRSTPASSPS